MGAGILMLLFGVAFMFGPWFVQGVPPIAGVVGLVLGAILSIFGISIIVVTRLYVKTAANTAFVRTGLGGSRVILDGGSLVIPVVHQIVTVSLHTFAIPIVRKEREALITGDKLRADVNAEFFIRVPADPIKILSAARSLGSKATNEQAQEAVVKNLLEAKLVNALRAVAATMDLEHLNTQREEFAKRVAAAVKSDIEINGFELESVTISSLDQTPVADLQVDNIFDAQGRKKIAEIVSKNRVEENIFNRTAEQQIAQQNASTTELVSQQQLKAKQAEVTRDANIQKASAEQEREAAVYAAEQKRQTQEAQLNTEQAVGQRTAEKNKLIKVAEIEAQQAAGTAEVVQQQAIEVANRQRQIVIAQAEQRRAAAEAEQLVAEQSRKREEQAVQTVQEVAAAERTKQVKVIDALQAAEVQKTQQNNQADIAAYQTVKQAEAAQQAAARKAEAITVEADAQKKAQVMAAEGQTAVAMVPINVKQKEVEVDALRQKDVEQARVDVMTRELEVKTRNQEVAVQLQQALKLIEAGQAIGVAQANALGQALASANLTFYGSKEMLENVLAGFQKGQSIQHVVAGLTVGGDKNPVNSLLAGTQDILGKMLPGAGSEPKADGKGGFTLHMTPEIIAMAKGLAATNPQAANILQLFAPQIFADAPTEETAMPPKETVTKQAKDTTTKPSKDTV